MSQQTCRQDALETRNHHQIGLDNDLRVRHNGCQGSLHLPEQ
ncbi:hypothetical protein XaavBphi31_02 [Xanthomonas phage Xaa_vB_phi31]|uniref:Uncharacterized protein n=1 Tax=Xanthomonas phage Xaa_vB_phi31 TaxID=2776752 RepID=A0A868BZ15_9CAUD|nr:hypothetical protein XaavBphi31_02 [Xanthomonas phage Xaa_vB_phi31]